MDFDFTEEQVSVRELATKILSDQVTLDRLRGIEAGPEWMDRATWGELAKANLLGIGLPEDVGGAGLGFFEVCLLLEQIGRTAAPLPAVATLVAGAATIDRFGNAEQRKTLLPGVIAGDTVLTAALTEVGADDPAQPTTTATAVGKAWTVTGTKSFVPALDLAARVLVPATSKERGVGLFLVDPSSTGATVTPLAMAGAAPLFRLDLDGVAVTADDLLGTFSDDGAAVRWLVEHAVVGLCATQLGVTAEALRLTADYTKQREQFGRPIATFQAVGQRAADMYIDVEGIRLTTWQAAWRLSEGVPASAEVAVAKFWAADAGQRVLHAAHHLHGGVGMDVDYPLHRYYFLAKQIELALGGATQHLVALGALLAARAAG